MSHQKFKRSPGEATDGEEAAEGKAKEGASFIKKRSAEGDDQQGGDDKMGDQ